MKTALHSMILASAMAMGCSMPSGDAPGGDDSRAAVGESLVNGTVRSTNPFLVALIRHDTHAGHPEHWGYTNCAGIVLKRTSTQSYVLTARHCLSETGSLLTEPDDASYFKVTTSVNPGPWVGASEGSAVASIADMDNPSGLIGNDLAVLVVNTRLSLTGDGYFGVNLDPTLYGTTPSFSVMSYGPTDADNPADMGTLRSAGGFNPKSDQTGYFIIDKQLANGTMIVSGDSGGSVLRTSAWGTSGTWQTLYGLVSTPVSTGEGITAVATNWTWIEARLGGVYISKPVAFGTHLACATASPTAGSALTYASGDSSRTRWSYDPSAGTLKLGGFCLYGSGTNLTLQTCASSNAYRWDLLPNGGYARLANRSSGKCVTNASTPRLDTCGTSSLAAVFHTQP